MKSHKNKNSRRPSALQFEQLEGRYTMSGTVLVTVTGVNLQIIGDNLENDIHVFGDAQHVLHIEGRNGTGVSIKDNKPLPGAFDIGKLTIDFKRADILLTNPPDPRGTHGVDTVEMDNLVIGNTFFIKGKDAGAVDMDQVTAPKTAIDFGGVKGISSILEGLGEPTLVKVSRGNLGFNGGPSSRLLGGCYFGTTHGPTHMEVRDTSLAGNVKFITKGGNDEIGLFNITPGFFIDGMKSLTIDTGKGDDLVALSGVDVIGKTTIKTGDGNDKVFIGGFDRNSFGGAASLDTGKGNDTIGVGCVIPQGGFTTTFDAKITVKTGAQDDKLMLGNQIVVSLLKPSVDGGPQTTADTLEVLNPPFDPSDTKIFKNWENRGVFTQQNLIDLQTEVINRF